MPTNIIDISYRSPLQELLSVHTDWGATEISSPKTLICTRWGEEMGHERRREDVAQLYSSGLLWLSFRQVHPQTFGGVFWDCLFFALIVSYFIFFHGPYFWCFIEVVHCVHPVSAMADAGDGLLETHGIPTGFCGRGPNRSRRWKGFYKCKSTVCLHCFKNSSDITWTLNDIIVELVIDVEFLISSPGLLVRPVLRNCSFCGARGVEGWKVGLGREQEHHGFTVYAVTPWWWYQFARYDGMCADLWGVLS